MKRLAILLLMLAVPVLPALAPAAGRPLEFNDLLRARRLSEPVISPDGRWVAYVQTTHDTASFKPATDIFLAPLAGGESRNLTMGGQGNSRPMFAPDGKSLVFSSTRSGSRQFYRLPLDGGEAVQLTDHPGGVSGGALSPDGKQLLYQAPVLVDSGAVVFAPGGDHPRARIFDRLLFRHWDSWQGGRYSHLFLDGILDGRPPRDLTAGRVDVPPISLGSARDYAFSREGGQLFYVANRDPVIAVSTNNDLWRVDPDGGNLTRLTASPANDNLVALSPDGRYLAYRAMERAGFEADRQRMMLLELRGGSPLALTDSLDRSVDEIVWHPREGRCSSWPRTRAATRSTGWSCGMAVPES